MATVIGWIFVAISVIVWGMAIAGFFYPPLLKDPKTGVAPSRLSLFFVAWLGPLIPGAIGMTLLF